LPNFSAPGTGPVPVAAAQFRRYCLFLDVDGTLVEFAASPDDVHVDPALAALIDRGSQALGGALALVSGRTLADLVHPTHDLVPEHQRALRVAQLPVDDVKISSTDRARLNIQAHLSTSRLRHR